MHSIDQIEGEEQHGADVGMLGHPLGMFGWRLGVLKASLLFLLGWCWQVIWDTEFLAGDLMEWVMVI